jgi:hypothetical protein
LQMRALLRDDARKIESAFRRVAGQ